MVNVAFAMIPTARLRVWWVLAAAAFHWCQTVLRGDHRFDRRGSEDKAGGTSWSFIFLESLFVALQFAAVYVVARLVHKKPLEL